MEVPVELQIYFHTDGTATCKELDIDYHISECEVRLMTFYNISCISPAKEPDGFEYGIIHCGDNSFASVLTYEQLKQKLR